MNINFDTFKSAIHEINQQKNNKYIVLKKGKYESSSIRTGKLQLGQLADIVGDFVQNNKLNTADELDEMRKALNTIIQNSTKAMNNWKFKILNFITLNFYGQKYQKVVHSLTENLRKIEKLERIKSVEESDVLTQKLSMLEDEIKGLKEELRIANKILKDIPEIEKCNEEIKNKEDEILKIKNELEKIKNNIEEIKKEKTEAEKK